MVGPESLGGELGQLLLLHLGPDLLQGRGLKILSPQQATAHIVVLHPGTQKPEGAEQTRQRRHHDLANG